MKLILFAAGFLLLAAIARAAGVVRLARPLGEGGGPRHLAIASPARFAGLVLILLVWLLILGAWVVVPAGQTGAVYNIFTGTSERRYLAEGTHLVLPAINTVTFYQTRVDSFTMSVMQGADDGTIEVPTKEGLQLDLDMTVWFYPDPVRLGWLHKHVGPLYRERIVRPSIRSVVRMVVRDYSAVEVYSEKRDEIERRIEERLREEMAKKGIVVDRVLLRDVIYKRDYAAAIQAKLIAEQEAQKMQYVLAKERAEAERKEIEARGEAAAIRIVKEEIARQGGDLYIQYLWAQKAPQGIKTVVVPGGSNILINPGE